MDEDEEEEGGLDEEPDSTVRIGTGAVTSALDSGTGASSIPTTTPTISVDGMAVDDNDNNNAAASERGKRKCRAAAKKASSVSSGRKKSKSSTSTSVSSTAVTAVKKTNKIQAGVALNDMQGSINRLTDTLEKSMTTIEDAAVARKDLAMRRLQEIDGDLPMQSIVLLLKEFNSVPGMA